MKFLILLVIFLLFFELSIAQESVELFGVFTSKFYHDSSFQISRIIFPLKYEYCFDHVNKKDSVVTQPNWQFSDYGVLKNEYNIQIYDNFKKTLRNTNERVVSFEGVECGIDLNMYFKLIRKKWYLVKIIDNSD
jgi:hypothetical protein